MPRFGSGQHLETDMGKELTQGPPHTRHHFTRFDQVDQLVRASESDAKIGYVGRMLALCCLPRTNPGDPKEYVRRNGPFTLGMSAGIDNKLPFGIFPRLLLAWVCTEAVRTQSRNLILGDSLSCFMRGLGVDPSGASFARVRNQMNRLFRCQISLIYTDRHGESSVSSLIADRTAFWWSEENPGGLERCESSIRLGEEFFNEIIRQPIPLDMNILRALTRSPLGLDLYQWINYRTFGLQWPVRLTWPRLYQQFGVDPGKAGDNSTVQHFRQDCLRELKKITVAWPGLHYETPDGALLLLPSTTPSIPPLLFPFRRPVNRAEPWLHDGGAGWPLNSNSCIPAVEFSTKTYEKQEFSVNKHRT